MTAEAPPRLANNAANDFSTSARRAADIAACATSSADHHRVAALQRGMNTESLRRCGRTSILAAAASDSGKCGGKDSIIDSKVKEVVWMVLVDAENSEGFMGRLIEVLVETMEKDYIRTSWWERAV